MEATASFFLGNYVYQVPVFIVWIAGAIIAIARWRRHPRPSLLLLLALFVFLLRALLAPVITFTLVHSGAASVVRVGFLQGIAAFISSLIAALAWTLLLAAALGWRDRT